MNPQFTSGYELTILYCGIVSIITAWRVWQLTKISRKMTPVERRTELGENLRWMWLGLVGFLLLTGVFYSLRFLAGDSLAQNRIQHEWVQAIMIVALDLAATVMLVKSGPVNDGMRALLQERNRQADEYDAQLMAQDERGKKQDEQQVVLDETSLINTKRGRYLSRAGVALDTRRINMANEQHIMDDRGMGQDDREKTADARDVIADDRDVTADARDVIADERDAKENT